LLAGVGFAVAKIFRPKPEASALSPNQTAWPPLEAAIPTPSPVQVPEPKPASVSKPAAKKPAEKAAAPAKKIAVKKTLPPWVDPKGTVCPQTHPVKGKLSSMIFQVPGNFAYERTTPDRCYKSADEAEDDGLRAAKR
jgi:hypothetical protein